MVVESKHTKRKIGASDISAFVAMVDDIGASKGIFVTSSGFSKSAFDRARQDGIALVAVDEKTSELKQKILLDSFPSVNPLFISARHDFFAKRPVLKTKVAETARQLGFDPVILENPRTGPIPEAVQKAMRGAKAVLQIIPLLCRPSGEFESVKEAMLDWIHFESGFAASRRLRIAMCVDIVGGATRVEWESRLAPRAGWALWTFNQSDGNEEIVADIRKAIEWLR